MTDELTRARDPHTPPAELQALASHPDLAVRAALVSNPSCPRLTLEALLEQAADDLATGRVLAEALLGNASLLVWLLQEPTWLQRCPVKVAVALARSERASDEVGQALSEHASKRVRLWLGCAPGCSAEEARRLVGVEGTVLDLSNEGLSAEDVRALVTWPGGADVTTLDLEGNQIGDAGAAALAQATSFPRLTTLYLWGNGIGDAGAAALAQATSFSSLTTLYLSSNDIGPRGAQALADGPAFPQLITVLGRPRSRR